MSPARLLSLSCAFAAALGLSACPSPCHNACAHEAACNSKLGRSSSTDVDSCAKYCEQDTTCVNRDEVENCLADMKCENTFSYGLETLACASLCKGQ